MQLQQKVSQREEEIKRLQQKCQRLNSVDIERLDKEVIFGNTHGNNQLTIEVYQIKSFWI